MTAAGESRSVRGVGSFHVRSSHLWGWRDGCGSGRARVTIVPALQTQCQAKTCDFGL